jgi:type II secretory pathway pseudopilin PulG
MIGGMSKSAQTGFTLVEVLIATALFMVMIAAFLTLNSNIVTENRALSQKMAAGEAARQLSQIFADDQLCKCNVVDPGGSISALQPYPTPTTPPSSFVTIGGSLKSQCSPPQIAVTANAPLPNSSVPLFVTGIFVGDLIDQTPTDPSSTHIYTGNIQVQIGDPPSGPKSLVRPIQPLRVSKKFFVDQGSKKILGCGASLNDILYVTANTSTQNGPLGSTYSVATCPAGMIAVGGGWILNSSMMVPGCPGQPYAAALASAPDQLNGGWQVLLLCHDYRAYATCQRANLVHGP